MPRVFTPRLPHAGLALLLPLLAAACGGSDAPSGGAARSGSGEPTPSSSVAASGSASVRATASPRTTASSTAGTSPAASASPASSGPAASGRASAGPGTSQTALPSASGSAAPSASARPTSTQEPEYQAPEDLAVGDCFDPVVDSDDDFLLAAIVRPCAQPHRAEVFGVEELEGGSTAAYPGGSEVSAQAETLCDAAFETYIGIDFDDSRYAYTFYTPSEATWLGGDRGVMCAVDDDGDPISGSLKGVKR